MTLYLEKADVVYINHRTVAEHGGNFMPPNNFLQEENLDYLVEAVQAEMFGEPLYPSVADKAALYAYNIICNHIFTDGNKRTGPEAALVFLKFNGMRLDKNLPLNDLYQFILNVASGEVTLQACRDWFAGQIVELPA